MAVIVKQMDAFLAARADASPAPNECSAAEEIRLDRQLVKARHIAAGVGALNIKVEPMLRHGSKIGRTMRRRPTTFLNRSSLTDSRC
ncbi:hypothetical protein ABIA24_003970 [Sinorhizobium fredii]